MDSELSVSVLIRSTCIFNMVSRLTIHFHALPSELFMGIIRVLLTAPSLHYNLDSMECSTLYIPFISSSFLSFFPVPAPPSPGYTNGASALGSGFESPLFALRAVFV